MEKIKHSADPYKRSEIKNIKNIDSGSKQVTFPKKGKNKKKAYDMVRKYLYGNDDPCKNMITFVTVDAMDTYMDKIHFDLRHINFIDTTVYKKTKAMEQQIVTMMAHLFNDKKYKLSMGLSTIGSSEAIYISSILHKFKWEERMKKKKVRTGNPNMIFSYNTHVNWDKSARWNDIEPRKVKLRKLNYNFGKDEVAKLLDKNTVCVACTVCTTRSGDNDNVKEINDFLAKYYKKTGVFVPIHIDAAIGGFLYPFLDPSYVWDFRLSHVKSINVSFHKYGGTYPGMGMILVKSDYPLPDKFRFEFNVEKTAASLSKGFTVASHMEDPHAGVARIKCDEAKKHKRENLKDWAINFSKPSSQIVTAYYLLRNLGFDGYKKRMLKCLKVAQYVSKFIVSIKNPKTGDLVFKQVNDPRVPVIAFYLQDPKFDLRKLLMNLEKYNGYAVASYKMAPNIDDIVMRFVIKPTFNMKSAKKFIEAIKKSLNN